MTLISNNTWFAAKVVFSGNANPRFKFDIFGDWSLNFGENDGDSIADQGGRDIAVQISPSAKSFDITFNDLTKKYVIKAHQ